MAACMCFADDSLIDVDACAVDHAYAAGDTHGGASETAGGLVCPGLGLLHVLCGGDWQEGWQADTSVSLLLSSVPHVTLAW